MHLGYNTNGLAFHRPEEALALLAEVGYESVAITVDHHCLDPFSPDLEHEIERMRRALARHRLESVIETGARFLLNPRIKHEPTLVSEQPDDRARRVDFLNRCTDIAAALNSRALSFWSGTPRDEANDEILFERLVAGCREVLDYAGARNVPVAFEPEPGMFIDTFARFDEFCERLGVPDLGLTVDVGHVHCLEEKPIPEYLERYAGRIHNIHIEDMRRGVHEHLRFGEGEIDFPPVMSTLLKIGYTGPVHVELSRHSHCAPEVVQESYDFLSTLIKQES